MSKWKCEICNSSFENFDARGFNNKIYCPLCYYKKLYKDTELERKKLQTQLQQKENIIKELNDKIEDDKMIIEGNWGCIDNLRKDYNLQKNIIKEVREYINNHFYMESTGGIQHPTFDGKMNRDTNGFELLEILDKEVN